MVIKNLGRVAYDPINKTYIFNKSNINSIHIVNLVIFFHFRLTPEDNNIIVFNKGNSKGLIDSTPTGGHWAPNSTVGDKALWK